MAEPTYNVAVGNPWGSLGDANGDIVEGLGPGATRNVKEGSTASSPATSTPTKTTTTKKRRRKRPTNDPNKGQQPQQPQQSQQPQKPQQSQQRTGTENIKDEAQDDPKDTIVASTPSTVAKQQRIPRTHDARDFPLPIESGKKEKSSSGVVAEEVKVTPLTQRKVECKRLDPSKTMTPSSSPSSPSSSSPAPFSPNAARGSSVPSAYRLSLTVAELRDRLRECASIASTKRPTILNEWCQMILYTPEARYNVHEDVPHDQRSFREVLRESGALQAMVVECLRDSSGEAIFPCFVPIFRLCLKGSPEFHNQLASLLHTIATSLTSNTTSRDLAFSTIARVVSALYVVDNSVVQTELDFVREQIVAKQAELQKSEQEEATLHSLERRALIRKDLLDLMDKRDRAASGNDTHSILRQAVETIQKLLEDVDTKQGQIQETHDESMKRLQEEMDINIAQEDRLHGNLEMVDEEEKRLVTRRAQLERELKMVNEQLSAMRTQKLGLMKEKEKAVALREKDEEHWVQAAQRKKDKQQEGEREKQGLQRVLSFAALATEVQVQQKVRKGDDLHDYLRLFEEFIKLQCTRLDLTKERMVSYLARVHPLQGELAKVQGLGLEDVAGHLGAAVDKLQHQFTDARTSASAIERETKEVCKMMHTSIGQDEEKTIDQGMLDHLNHLQSVAESSLRAIDSMPEHVTSPENSAQELTRPLPRRLSPPNRPADVALGPHTTQYFRPLNPRPPLPTRTQSSPLLPTPPTSVPRKASPSATEPHVRPPLPSWTAASAERRKSWGSRASPFLLSSPAYPPPDYSAEHTKREGSPENLWQRMKISPRVPEIHELEPENDPSSPVVGWGLHTTPREHSSPVSDVLSKESDTVRHVRDDGVEITYRGPGQPPIIGKGKPFGCSGCTRRFRNERDLSKHMKAVHPELLG